MNEETNLMNAPKKLWDGALKMVKGENTAQLVEQFTAEMTLVAEGLSVRDSDVPGSEDSVRQWARETVVS